MIVRARSVPLAAASALLQDCLPCCLSSRPGLALPGFQESRGEMQKYFRVLKLPSVLVRREGGGHLFRFHAAPFARSAGINLPVRTRERKNFSTPATL